MLDKILKSSKNPEEVSLRVKGILMNIVGIIVIAGGSQAYGVEYLSEGVDQISRLIGTIALLIGQIQIVWGWVRSLNK